MSDPRWFLLRRQGGPVERMHTTPHLGSYSVASHSWGVALIILAIQPDASASLLKAALLHDIHERYLGDLPAQAKWRNPGLRDAFDAACATVDTQLGVMGIELTREERNLLAVADSIDLLLWAYDQEALGNSSARRVAERLYDHFEVMRGEHRISKQAGDFIDQLRRFRERNGWSLDHDLP